MLLYDVGISTQILRRRRKEVIAAYEVILSCSAAFLGENSLCQLQLNMLCTSGVAAITYYAIYFPQITTVAHLLAGVLSHKHLLPLIYFLSRSLITTHCHQEWIWTDLSIFFQELYLLQLLLGWSWGWCFSLLKRWVIFVFFSVRRRMDEKEMDKIICGLTPGLLACQISQHKQVFSIKCWFCMSFDTN